MTPHAGRRPAPALSTCTVTWNSGAKLDAFLAGLEALKAEAPFPFEAIVVDNASSDGTPDRIEARCPWVRVVRNDRNDGFAGGSNRALEAARGDHLMLLNPDCVADARALAGMVGYLRRHPSAGAAGCALLHGDGLPQRTAHGEPGALSFLLGNSCLSPLFERAGKAWHRLTGGSRRPRAVGWLQGSCIVLRRDVYEAVGGLDEGYFMYSEDADWCRRIREAGWRVVFLPNFRMTHFQKTSAKGSPEFTFRRLYRSMALYAIKWMPPPKRFLYFEALKADLWLRQPLYRAAAVLGRMDPKRARGRIESCRVLIKMLRRGDPGWRAEAPPSAGR
ncbi:MAG: glycosyltransferase family 2 protein [Candidatus Sumerlaeia bacterium]|nr:glycosyltransferase family 2 protein [Candidatus Sumerlaeia bacterium]